MRRGEENLGGQPHGVASRTRARSKAGAAKPEEAASSKREQAAARVKAAREAAAAAQRAAAAARREAQQVHAHACSQPCMLHQMHYPASSRTLACELTPQPPLLCTQTPSAAPRRPIDQASPHSALSEGVDSRALAAERQLQQHRDEEYWAGWAEEAAARGEQALQQDMEDACVG
jgi:hypothetical protein